MGLHKATKSRHRVRSMILDALAYGSRDRRAPSHGAIFLLLKKLDGALRNVDDCDVESIKKIADTYLKLAAYAMPTAAQSEAIEKGIAPTNPGAVGNDLLNMLEAHLVQRRAILARSIQPTESVVIESIPNLSELARVELSKRRASFTPPPTPGVEGGVETIGGRAPTISQPSSPRIEVGTRDPSPTPLGDE